jgi:hypothetical protein
VIGSWQFQPTWAAKKVTRSEKPTHQGHLPAVLAYHLRELAVVANLWSKINILQV